MSFIKNRSVELISLVYYVFFFGNYVVLQSMSSSLQWEDFVVYKEEIRIAVAISSVGFYNVVIGKGRDYPSYSGMALLIAVASLFICFFSWQLAVFAFIMGMRQLLIGILVISGSRILFYRIESIMLLVSILTFYVTGSLNIAYLIPASWVFLFWSRLNLPLRLSLKDVSDGITYLVSGVITGLTYLRVKTDLGDASLYEFEIFLFTVLSGTIFNYVFLKMAEEGRKNFRIASFMLKAVLFYVLTKVFVFFIFKYTVISDYLYSGFVEDSFFTSSWFSLLLVSSFVLMSSYNLKDKPYKTIIANGAVYVLTMLIISLVKV